MRYLTPLLLLLLCTCGPALLLAQTVTDFDAVATDYFPADGPGGTAIVVKDGKTIYHKGFGMADLELGVAMQPGNVFRIGSITKQFTAAAILKLVEDGKMSLDDEITRFLPDYPTQRKTITVHHLLNHTSGIVSYTGLEEWNDEVRRQDFTPDEMIEFFAKEKMEFAPGEKMKYNNSGYFLLSYLVEKASGMTYEDYIEQEFFAKLGMENSRYGHELEIVPDRAHGYMPAPGGYQHAAYLSMTQPWGAGSLLSTVEDLSTWYHAVAAGKVISPESLAKATAPTILNDGSTEDYGYGLSIQDVKGSKGYGHGGGINGFLTASTYLPEEKVFVAVFSNCNCNPPNNLASRLAEVAIGKYEPVVAIEVEPRHLKSYVGKYDLLPGMVVEIRLEGEQLIGQATGQGAFPLTPVERHTFVNEGAGIKVRFNPDIRGKVKTFTLFQGGGELEATRKEE